MQIAPVVVFPLTVGEGCLLLYLAVKGPNGTQVSWFMHLVIASTLAVTLFYLLEASSGRCILKSTFERPLEPLHYLMWMVTMVIDSVTLHILMAIQRRARGEDVPLSEEQLAADAAAQVERAVAGGAQGAGALPLGPLPAEEQRGSIATVNTVELTLEDGARSY